MKKDPQNHRPRLLALELTRRCRFNCQHCRADAIPQRDKLELTFEEGQALMRDVKEMGSMMILTGGDPLLMSTRRIREILAQRFLPSVPPPGVVQRLADKWLFDEYRHATIYNPIKK